MPATTLTPDRDTAALQRFNHAVLGQALALVAAHLKPGAPAYARPVGAHLRHVIEHCEALFKPAQPGVVDYDSRPRDAALEADPRLAQARLQALQQHLTQGTPADLHAPLVVRGLGGLAGEFAFAVPSSLGRELVFVASHAVHHFALLQAHCAQHGMAVDAEFGKAPATVAHERKATTTPFQEPTPCPQLLSAA